jgi:hypothetical protein
MKAPSESDIPLDKEAKAITGQASIYPRSGNTPDSVANVVS